MLFHMKLRKTVGNVTQWHIEPFIQYKGEADWVVPILNGSELFIFQKKIQSPSHVFPCILIMFISGKLTGNIFFSWGRHTIWAISIKLSLHQNIFQKVDLPQGTRSFYNKGKKHLSKQVQQSLSNFKMCIQIHWQRRSYCWRSLTSVQLVSL